MTDKRGYNRREAAAYLGISPSMLDAERRASRITPRYSHGGITPLYDKRELDRWFDDLPSEPKTA